jgi:hypothetical protein
VLKARVEIRFAKAATLSSATAFLSLAIITLRAKKNYEEQEGNARKKADKECEDTIDQRKPAIVFM